VIPMTERIDRDKICRLRDSVWKSILELYKTGAEPCLPEGLEELNNLNNLDYTDQSVLYQPLASYLGSTNIVASKVKVRLAMQETELVQPGRLNKEIAMTMAQLGWKTGRSHDTPRYWVRAEHEGTDAARNAARQLDHSVPCSVRGW